MIEIEFKNVKVGDYFLYKDFVYVKIVESKTVSKPSFKFNAIMLYGAMPEYINDDEIVRLEPYDFLGWVN